MIMEKNRIVWWLEIARAIIAAVAGFFASQA